jgi:hypothetical protein
MTVAICALITPIIGMAQSPSSAAALAKYDKNKNGRLDPDEIAAMQVDLAKNGGVTLNPFEIDALSDQGYPRTPDLHIFEKIDSLDTRAWRYARIDNIEVLSRCADQTTERFVDEVRSRLELMKSVHPEPAIASLDFPLRLFLFMQGNDELSWNNMESVPAPIPVGAPYGREAFSRYAKDNVTLMVNLWNYEIPAKSKADETALRKAADEVVRAFVTAQLQGEAYASAKSRGEAQGRKEFWLFTGLSNFYSDLHTVTGSAHFGWPPSARYRGVLPLTKKSELPSLEGFFAFPDFPSLGDRGGERWLLQLGLFTRWALLGDHQAHQRAFWKFAVRSRTEPITETLFNECFEMSFSQVQAALADHVQTGWSEIGLSLVTTGSMSQLNLRNFSDATAPEIERFKNSVTEAYDETRPRL